MTELRLNFPVSLTTNYGYGTKFWAMQHEGLCVQFWEGPLRRECDLPLPTILPARCEADVTAEIAVAILNLVTQEQKPHGQST